MRRPATYFATVLNRIMSTNLPNTLFAIQAVMCHTDDILRNKSDLRILNKSQGRSYFVTVLNKLTSTHLPKTLLYILTPRIRDSCSCSSSQNNPG